MKSAAAVHRRPYRQGARAVAAEQTAERILDAFERRMREDWYDEITLEEIAREAEVTVPTIIRRFGGKEKLLEAAWQRIARDVEERRTVVRGDAAAAVRVIVADYEVLGDTVMRALAQEQRFPALKRVNDMGRAYHRAWINAAFARWLDELPAAARRQRLDALVAATDLYVWNLVRRDMARSVQHLRTVMLGLIEGALRVGAKENRRE
jgi:AcrR family transcriptional regulator